MKGCDTMTNIEKAKIILNELDEVISIDWNFEETYLKPIVNALIKIQKAENE